MEKDTWKIIAIIFMILFILETLFLFYAFNLGVEIETNDLKCSDEICYNLDATSYLYEDTYSLCQCYKNGEIIYQEVIK